MVFNAKRSGANFYYNWLIENLVIKMVLRLVLISNINGKKNITKYYTTHYLLNSIRIGAMVSKEPVGVNPARIFREKEGWKLVPFFHTYLLLSYKQHILLRKVWKGLFSVLAGFFERRLTHLLQTIVIIALSWRLLGMLFKDKLQSSNSNNDENHDDEVFVPLLNGSEDRYRSTRGSMIFANFLCPFRPQPIKTRLLLQTKWFN